MADYIETKTKNGTILRIEVEAAPKAAAGFSGRTSTSPNVSGVQTADAYEQTLMTIHACADGISDTLQSLKAVPSAASVEFAIKIDAEAGTVIAKTREDAQFKVSLSWKQAEPEQKE